jgi:hypothetical protein
VEQAVKHLERHRPVNRGRLAGVRVAVATGTNDPAMVAHVDKLHPDILYRKPLDVNALLRWLDEG